MMGRATILTILSFWLSVAQAAENSFGPQCPDFSVTGIESKEKFGSFLFDLRILLRQNHESVASDLVMYPLRVNGKISELINSEAELLRKYDSVFTDAVIKSIGRAASDDLSCNAEGVIFGEGDSYIWVTERDGKVGVVAVNLPVSTPSFDCSKASSSTEKIICDNPELGALDQDLNKRYKLALTQSDVVKKQQKIWLKTIKRCTDDVCLINEYKSRISVLSSVGIQSGSDKLYVEEVFPKIDRRGRLFCNGNSRSAAVQTVRY